MSDEKTQEETPVHPLLVEHNSVPPINFERNQYGLFKHVDYHFKEDGTVDWRKMIKPEFLVVNSQSFERRKQAVPTSIEGLEDKDLLILLGGLKELARLRGYESVQHEIKEAVPGYVAVKTTIKWIPNYESQIYHGQYGQVQTPIIFESIADAHKNNTEGFTQLYLAAIAENRGFTRAVRNFLGINITGKEEIGTRDTEQIAETSDGNPRKLLEDLLDKAGIKFESFHNQMMKVGVVGAGDWTSLKSIPTEQVYEVISTTNKLLDERKKKLSSKA